MRVFFAAGLMVILSSTALFALPKYLETFKKSYPDAAGTKLAGCAICHPVKGKMKEQSLFAQDFKKAGHDFAKIANIDSDKDRFINAEEIAARTFPQDESDKPDIAALIKQINGLKQKIEQLEAKIKAKE